MTEVDPQLPEFIGYQVFVDSLTQLLFTLIENPDLGSCVGLLNLLYARIYRVHLIDVKCN